MVEYLSGNRIQGSSTLTTSPPQTSWKILNRANLSGGTSQTLNVSYADRDHVMILVDWARESGASSDPKQQLGDSSADTGSNYASVFSANGSDDETTHTGKDYITKWATGSGSSVRNFDMLEFVNPSDGYKLGVTHGVFSGAQGAANQIHRTESTFKWGSNSQAGYYSLKGASTCVFSTSSEVVVLGMNNDEEDGGTTTPNAWQKLAETTTIVGTGSNCHLTTEAFTPKKYLWIQAQIKDGAGNQAPALRFGADGTRDNGSNYSRRAWVHNSTSDSAPSSAQDWIQGLSPPSNASSFDEFFVVNKSTNDKLVIGHSSSVYNQSNGNNNFPRRTEVVGRWVNSGQINCVSMSNDDTGTFGTGSRLVVWGFD
tara:strand:+ start:11721 stop:12830 length:1110 start_codon:yes stop_codon:yes gene_type:complete